MFGSTRISAVLGAAPAPSTDPADIRPFVRAACAAGLAIMFVKPGTKLPLDPRSVKQRRDEDKAAQAAAQAAGNPRWAKVTAPSGLHLATSDAKVAVRYLDAAVKMYADPVNFAMEVGRSNLIVVDVDTELERAAFLSWWSANVGRDMRAVPPTVTSPGAMDPATGEWVHKGGGHYYFTIPDGLELPSEVGNYTHRTEVGTFAVAWSGRYVLIPPSVRPEGAYTFSGMDMPAPAALLELITGRAEQFQANRDRAAERAASADGGDFQDGIDAWADSVSWDAILEPNGWTASMDTDGCGCAIWTAPGLHNSPKSATAHDSGCELGRYTLSNAPLHVWTDHTDGVLDAWMSERGVKTITKLQLVALYHYDGDTTAACRDLGLSSLTEGTGAAVSDADLKLDRSAMDAALSGSWDLPDVPPVTPPAAPAPTDVAPTVDYSSPPPDPEPSSMDALFGRPMDEAHDAGDASHTDYAHHCAERGWW